MNPLSITVFCINIFNQNPCHTEGVIFFNKTKMNHENIAIAAHRH